MLLNRNVVRRHTPGTICAVGAALVMTLSIRSTAQLPPQIGQVRHNSGDNVVPVFEGWEKNPDGTFNLVFGYMNRNYVEEPEIPIGPDNNFSIGPADQGQPTHFYPRRQQFMFKVKVPADFGGKEIVWTLTTRGKTERAYATLKPDYMIDSGIHRRGGPLFFALSLVPLFLLLWWLRGRERRLLYAGHIYPVPAPVAPDSGSILIARRHLLRASRTQSTALT